MSNIVQSSVAEFPASRTLAAPTLFSNLSALAQADLLAKAPLRAFGSGAIIQQRGEVANGFWVIEQGSVTVGQFLAEGQFRAVATLGVGDSYGELAVLSGRPRAVDSIARGPASLRWIDAARFERAIANDPASMRGLLGAMAEELQEMLDVVAGLRSGNASRRIAAILSRLARQAGVDEAVAITQQEIADLAGVTRATVSSALACLEDEGIVRRKYRAIEIEDLKALELIALD